MTENSDDTSYKKVVNLTIVASIRVFEGIGMASGFNFYFMSIVSISFDVIVTRIPKVGKRREESEE